MTFARVRFGYVPYSEDLSAPADRRRFLYWARHRDIRWERAEPGGRYDVVHVATSSDLVRWQRADTGGAKIVYELIDSYLDVPASSIQNRLRGIAKFATGELSRPVMDYHALLESMCRRANAVVCSTQEQRSRLLALNPRVHAILDAHTDLAVEEKNDYALGDTVNLVWEGLPYTLDDFEVITSVLREIDRERPLALHLVTDLSFGRVARRFGQVRTEEIAHKILPRTYVYEWNDQLLAKIVTACDLAVIPLDLQDPLARGKPENKLLIFWRMAMPAITSATPAYLRVMGEAGLDLACVSADEWAARLRSALDDESARREAGAAGARYIKEHHSLDAILARWDSLFTSVLD